MDHYLTKDSPSKAISRFALPMVVGSLFQQIYTLVDSAVVGKYVGEAALASIGASFALTTIFICIGVGGGAGASVLIARYFGSRDYKRMKTAIFTAIIGFLVLSLGLSAFGLIFSKDLMGLLKTPEEILDMAVLYLNIYFYGLPFLFMYNIISALYQALGESKIPLYFLIFSSVLNVILDVYFVRDLGFGLAGAAYATLLAQGLSAVLSFFVFLRKIKTIKTEKTKIFDKREFALVSKLALPSIVQQSTITIGQLLVQSVVNSFGVEILAGFSAAMRVESLIIVPITSLGNALSSYTSQNVGAEKLDRLEKGLRASLIMVGIYSLLVFALLKINSTSIIAFFMNESSSNLAIDTGMAYLNFIGFFFVLVGSKHCIDGVLRGLGDVRVFTFANIVNLFIRVSLSMTLAHKIGIGMVWYAVPLGWLANLLISSLYYGHTKKRGYELSF
ncbi:MATE family efflux transporter [Anaerococcus murdochii]|uniref:Probable multidrug resistance protein NorM n=1 Tax=Anaerococcus murdochii TaxID=411577 RepID=A0ABS7SZN9_9FIRM|nr:MATE family efflux transporter [Anaerococcus murdochii]MBZ2386983.1 MATE family efflux transporter [Anaerococcus murdochii]